jgi:hypothetical protein
MTFSNVIHTKTYKRRTREKVPPYAQRQQPVDLLGNGRQVTQSVDLKTRNKHCHNQKIAIYVMLERLSSHSDIALTFCGANDGTVNSRHPRLLETEMLLTEKKVPYFP